MYRLRFLYFTSVLAMLGTAANAQQQKWTVTNLHPAGATASQGVGVGVGGQVGWALVGGVYRASLWNGSAATWKDLHLAWASSSTINSVDGTRQGGSATLNGLRHGIVWFGDAASAVDMTPTWAGATGSALVLAGDHEFGHSLFNGVPNAGKWNGTPESWVNMNPPGATSSDGWGSDGVQHVGIAKVNGISRASLWNDSDIAWTDLSPAGSAWSLATSVSDGQQGGHFLASIPGYHNACIWRGTSTSFVNLHPAGIPGDSKVIDVRFGQQVGVVNGHASLWYGAPNGWVDLHSFLPRNTFSQSAAQAIWQDETYIYVVGSGHNTKTKREEALMWRRRR